MALAHAPNADPDRPCGKTDTLSTGLESGGFARQSRDDCGDGSNAPRLGEASPVRGGISQIAGHSTVGSFAHPAERCVQPGFRPQMRFAHPGDRVPSRSRITDCSTEILSMKDSRRFR